MKCLARYVCRLAFLLFVVIFWRVPQDDSKNLLREFERLFGVVVKQTYRANLLSEGIPRQIVICALVVAWLVTHPTRTGFLVM